MAAEADVVAVVSARDEASDTLKSVSSSMGGLVGQFALGNIVANAATSAWEGLKDTFKEAYTASNTIENSMAQINQILKDNNDASGQSAKGIEEWAAQVNATTPISKEAALAGAQTLLTFTDIGKNVFPLASKATEDLAEHLAGGGVVSSDQMTQAAKRLGVALTDPSTGFSRLKQAGITFTESQEAAIKSMQTTNGVGAAQTLMLQDLSSKMGDSATAAGNTFAGSMTRIRDILVNVVEIRVIDVLKQSFEDLVNFLNSNKDVFSALVGGVAALAAIIGGLLTAAIYDATAAFISLDAAAAPWIALAVAIGAALGAIAYVIIKNWPAIHQAIQPVINDFKQDVWPIIKQIGDYVGGQFKQAWDSLKQSFDQLATTLAPYKPQLEDLAKVLGVTLLVPIVLLTTTIVLFVAAITAALVVGAKLIAWIVEAVVWFGQLTLSFDKAVAGIVSDLASDGAAIVNWFLGLEKSILNAVSGAGKWLYQTGKDIIKGLVNGIDDAVGGVSGALSKVGSDVGNAVKGALHTIHVPGFATGGIIPATPGGQLIIAGEGGQDEAIVPLPNGANSIAGIGGQTTNNDITVNITVQAQAFMGSQIQARQFAQQILQSLQDYAVSKNTSITQLVT